MKIILVFLICCSILALVILSIKIKKINMKILKHADKPIKCDRCGCEFLCDNPNDIHRNEAVMCDDGFLGILPCLRDADYVYCPECHERIILRWGW